MARNGTGTYVLPAGQPVVTNTTINSTVFNTLAADLATALTTSVCTDGQTPMAANLAMGSNKITGLANGTLSTDAVNKSQMDAVSTAYAEADIVVQTAIPRFNAVVNGDFYVALRSSTYALTTTPAYGSIDNWFSYQSTTAAGTFNRVADTAGNGRIYAARLGRNNGATSTGSIGCGQAIITNIAKRFAGKTVVFSFYAKAGANFSAASSNILAILRTGTGTDQSAVDMVSGVWTGFANAIAATQAITTSWVRYTFSATLASSVTQLGIQFAYTPVGTAGADDNLYLADVQLEESINGSVLASPFNRLSPADAIRQCEHYYQRVHLCHIGTGTAAGNVGVCIALPTRMRAIPTATQITNGYSTSQVNVTTNTSTYINTDNASVIAYRVATATGSTQFSELTALSAEL